MLFIDFEKAFDSIDHHVLFDAMFKLGLPQEIIDIVTQLYKDTYSDIITGLGITKPIHIKRGVRQGDILSLLLFNLFMECLTRCLQMTGLGYTFAANTAINIAMILFADDMALIINSSVKLQKLVDQLKQAIANTGLKININKTVFATNKYVTTNAISVNGTQIHFIPQ